jgi:beta-galactosidase
MPQNYFEMDLDRVVGIAYWGAVDYLGESSGWPSKGWGGGVFDIALEPRPKAYLMKSIFKPDEPLVHIAVVEQKQQVVAYTNADEVELLIDGKSLGRQPNPKTDPKQRNQICWEGITFTEGSLEAVAYDAGKAVARHKIETPGKAVRLRVTPEDDSWQADGTDLMHLRIEAVDSKGRRVTMADDEIHFSVEGDASLVAVGNGDMRSNEPNVARHRRLWNGSALVILRSGRSLSKVVLKTTAEAFKPVTTVLRTSP